MRRAFVCAAILFFAAAAGAQEPPPAGQPASPAPKKKKKKKRPKLVTENEVYGKPKKGAAPPANVEAAPPPAGLLAPVPATPAESAPPQAEVPQSPPAVAPQPTSSPPALAEPTVATPPEKDTAEKRFDPTASVPPPDEAPQTFSLRAEPAWGYRRFLDTEASSTDKRFGTGGVFLVGARAELYPFAGAHAGFMRDFGVTGSYFRALKLTVTDFDKNESVDAVWFGYSAGVRARLLSRRSPFALGLTAGYENWVFDFDTPVAPIRLIPTGRYSLLEGGIDARESFGKFSLFLEAAYLYAMTVATLGERTPEKGAYGGRGTFGVAFKLAPVFEIDAHATYTVMRFSLASVAGRTDEPGRVFDQYLVTALGLRLNL